MNLILGSKYNTLSYTTPFEHATINLFGMNKDSIYYKLQVSFRGSYSRLKIAALNKLIHISVKILGI